MALSDVNGPIGIHLEESILRIQMNRPEKKNALTQAMYQSMTDAILGADKDPAVRVVLLTGTKDCFTSGNDLADFIAVQSASGGKHHNPFLAAISRAEKPIVAAVNGPAVGIGTTMLLHCDLVYAGEKARFQLPFVNLGVCPELASSLLLPRLIGHQRAAELFLLGEPFDAAAARALGLVNAVYSEEEYLDQALQKARRLAGQPPSSVRITKSLMKRPLREEVDRAIEEELGHFIALLKGPAAAEAFLAFVERRKPDFSRCP
jgi:enoyl-CoA hydratase/carnithine racemase